MYISLEVATKKKYFYVKTRKGRKYLILLVGTKFIVCRVLGLRGEDIVVEKLEHYSVEVGKDNLLRLVYPSRWLIDRETRLIYISSIDATKILCRKPRSGSSPKGNIDPVTCCSLSVVLQLLFG